jgi:hypothetical protein
VALALASCADERTEVVVIVDSDLSVPDEIDRFRLEGDLDMDPRTAEADLTLDGPPRTLGLVHRGGPLGPLSLRAVALSGTTEVVERQATVSFRPGETLQLRFDLLRACAPSCPALFPMDLAPWPDGVTSDAGAGP